MAKAPIVMVEDPDSVQRKEVLHEISPYHDPRE
jgi:hypothetical protein